MVFEKKSFLVGGRKTPKTKEKIRLKLRQLLNIHSKCILGISTQKDDRLRFFLEQQGYKAIFYIYKSNAIDSVKHFHDAFQDLYLNELDVEEGTSITEELGNSESGPGYVFLAARKGKKGY